MPEDTTLTIISTTTPLGSRTDITDRPEHHPDYSPGFEQHGSRYYGRARYQEVDGPWPSLTDGQVIAAAGPRTWRRKI